MQVERKRNSIEFELSGRYALFSQPVMRVGGEKISYTIPTYQALKGIVESIYWRPTIIWVIDAVRIMNEIQTESKGIRPIKYFGGNDLAYYTYLKDVRYQVLAHFEFNMNRPELEKDRNEHKHHNIARRMVQAGGRRDVFLGTRECVAYVEPCVFGQGDSYYQDDGETGMGFMFHGYDYPDETGKNELGVRFWHSKMNEGVVLFPPPHSPDLLCRTIKKASMKQFALSNNKWLYSGDEKEGEYVII